MPIVAWVELAPLTDAALIPGAIARALQLPISDKDVDSALLAAIMSTISSQLLVSSSSLTEDFYRLFLRKNASEREAVTVGRISVALVALAGIAIAADPDSEVLSLVLLASL